MPVAIWLRPLPSSDHSTSMRVSRVDRSTRPVRSPAAAGAGAARPSASSTWSFWRRGADRDPQAGGQRVERANDDPRAQQARDPRLDRLSQVGEQAVRGRRRDLPAQAGQRQPHPLPLGHRLGHVGLHQAAILGQRPHGQGVGEAGDAPGRSDRLELARDRGRRQQVADAGAGQRERLRQRAHDHHVVALPHQPRQVGSAELDVGLIDHDQTAVSVGHVARRVLAGGVVGRADPGQARALGPVGEHAAGQRGGTLVEAVAGLPRVGRVAARQRQERAQDEPLVGARRGHDLVGREARVLGDRLAQPQVARVGIAVDRNARQPGRRARVPRRRPRLGVLVEPDHRRCRAGSAAPSPPASGTARRLPDPP